MTVIYKDNSNVSAGAASTAPDGKVFKHWVLQKWDGNAYQDTEARVEIDFAVEVPEVITEEPNTVKPSAGTGSGRRIVYIPNTSDPYKALPYFITGILSLILFACSAYLLWRTREEK